MSRLFVPLRLLFLHAPALLPLVLASCVARPINPTREVAPSPSVPPTAAPLPSATFPSPTPALPSVSQLPCGEYMVVASRNLALGRAAGRQLYSVLALPMPSGPPQLLAEGLDSGSALSPGGDKIAVPVLQGPNYDTYQLDIHDLETRTVTPVPRRFPSDLFSWGHEGTTLLTSLRASDAHSCSEIVSVDYRSGGVHPLTDCCRVSPEASCYAATSSPDGEWIEFYLATGSQFGSPLTGAYLLESECTAQPPACMENARGPFGYGEHAVWSNESTQLAFASGDHITLLDIATSHATRLPSIADSFIVSLAWSPDSTKIAFTQTADDATWLYVADVATGAIERLQEYGTADTHILAWVSTCSALVSGGLTTR